MKVFISSLILFFASSSLAWERSLECWQCAAIPDTTTKCPSDATLYRMTNWDACMIWTLKWDNKVVLQNFVKADVDCTRSRLKFWSEYIELIWKEPGTAKCCYENRCNDGLEDIGDDSYVPVHVDIPTSKPEVTTPEEPEVTSTEVVEESDAEVITLNPEIRKPEVAAIEEFEGIVALDECMKCFAIPNAVCDSTNLINRVDTTGFMKDKFENPECRCHPGFIAIYERNEDGIKKLKECHDPIISTSTVGGRCLIPEHCDKLENTACKEDYRIQNYKSCQCKNGFVQMSVSDDTRAMTCEPAKKDKLGGCSATGDCAAIMYSQCNSVTDKCECQPGFISYYDNDTLVECQDPIVLTSTVNGYCLVDEHCRNLEGTQCSVSTGRGQFKRCQCIEGYDPLPANPVSGIIERCAKQSSVDDVISVIAQGIFGDPLIRPDPQPLLKFPTDASGLEICSRQTTVVESNEWVPNEKFPMTYDNITDSWMSVVFAKIPSSALPTHGVLIRFMSSIPDFQNKLMYTVTLYKNRQMTILKSFLDSAGKQKEVVQVVKISDSFKWLSHISYTGFWLLYKQGYLALGILHENTVDKPLMSWTDPHASFDISEVGLSTVGAAVLYGVDCGLDSTLLYPEGTCRLTDADCESIPNTHCIKPTSMPGPLILVEDGSNQTIQNPIEFPSCQCKEGFEPIPDPFRALSRGCYDPVIESLTVNSRCISDRHCQKLKNTECKSSSLFDETFKTCRCIQGTYPSPVEAETGLVLGCEENLRGELNSVLSCKNRFSIKERKDWIPQTILKMPYLSRRSSYSMAFYVRLDPSVLSPGSSTRVSDKETLISIKLMDAKKSPDKIYKVTLSSSGNVSIYENIKGSTFLFGNFFRETLRMKEEVLAKNEIISNDFAGFWIRYQNVGSTSGTITFGRIGSDAPLQVYRDVTNTAISDTAYLGFEVEQGNTMEFGALCFDE